jgi:hypothetical protein
MDFIKNEQRQGFHAQKEMVVNTNRGLPNQTANTIMLRLRLPCKVQEKLLCAFKVGPKGPEEEEIRVIASHKYFCQDGPGRGCSLVSDCDSLVFVGQ